ncbi:hypothetical protein PFISCL1PPCAC_526, partial [Pristionchus fissidentatus]
HTSEWNSRRYRERPRDFLPPNDFILLDGQFLLAQSLFVIERFEERGKEVVTQYPQIEEQPACEARES